MKKKLYVFIAIILFACNSSTNENTIGEDSSTMPGTDKLVNDHIGCYMKVTGRDTTILMLEQVGDDLNGKMIFDNYQKDGSSGTVNGRREGEIIRLWYDFFSEGMNSKMEIYFKFEEGKLIRGIGEIDVKNDSAFYKNVQTIGYPATETFEKVACAGIEGKF